MPILHLIRKPLSILRTACSSVFQLAASDRETSSLRPDQQQVRFLSTHDPSSAVLMIIATFLLEMFTARFVSRGRTRFMFRNSFVVCCWLCIKSFCQASDQAFLPSLASKAESVTIVVKVEAEMAATNAHVSARILTLRNRIGSVATSVKIFQRNDSLPSGDPKFNLAYTGLFVFFCLAAATTIATLQIEQRNKTANYLDQKVTPELILDGQYTCACTLPQNLLALQKTPIQTVSNSDLQRCYSKDELSTITVVQFNNNTAYDVAKTVKSFNATVNLSYASDQKGWVFLEQEETELVLWTGTDNGTLSSICKGVPYLGKYWSTVHAPTTTSSIVATFSRLVFFSHVYNCAFPCWTSTVLRKLRG